MNETVRKMSLREVQGTYNDILLMSLPLLAIAIYFYGLRPVGLCATALLTANLCDRLADALRRQVSAKENSSLAFAMILTLMMPATVRYYTIIVCVVITVLVGKVAFGGYGAYPFFPPAIGYAVAVVSWPQELLRFPQPFTQLPLLGIREVMVVDGASHTLAVGGMPNISLFNLILGNYAGAMGATACLVMVACAMYLWMRKRITLFAPLGFLAACAFIAFFFPRLGGIGAQMPWLFVRERLLVVLYELLSGAILYAAVFLINDPVCLPRTAGAQCIYGVLLGFATMMFRYYGSYDTGVCFAILAVSAFSAPIERGCAAAAAALRSIFARKGGGKEAASHEPNT